MPPPAPQPRIWLPVAPLGGPAVGLLFPARQGAPLFDRAAAVVHSPDVSSSGSSGGSSSSSSRPAPLTALAIAGGTTLALGSLPSAAGTGAGAAPGVWDALAPAAAEGLARAAGAAWKAEGHPGWRLLESTADLVSFCWGRPQISCV
jgi:hypothetical protein